MSTAQKKIMDLLATRDHSEKELREKLQDHFAPDDIEEALSHAREKRWLSDPAELAGRLAEAFHRNRKGIHSINAKLEEKGLPPIPTDDEQELEKALSLAQTKLSSALGKDAELDENARAKIGRFLIGRGFDSSIVRKVIYEKL